MEHRRELGFALPTGIISSGFMNEISLVNKETKVKRINIREP